MMLAFLPMLVVWALALALPIIVLVLIRRWVRAAERSADAQERIAGAVERIAHAPPQDAGPTGGRSSGWTPGA